MIKNHQCIAIEERFQGNFMTQVNRFFCWDLLFTHRVRVAWRFIAPTEIRTLVPGVEYVKGLFSVISFQLIKSPAPACKFQLSYYSAVRKCSDSTRYPWEFHRGVHRTHPTWSLPILETFSVSFTGKNVFSLWWIVRPGWQDFRFDRLFPTWSLHYNIQRPGSLPTTAVC